MATDFVDTLHDTVTKTRAPVVAGRATRVIPTEAYFGMLLQLKGDGLEFEVVVEGATAQTQGEKIAESDWVEMRTFTKGGIYEVYPLPAQTRVRVAKGTLLICQAELIKQSSQFQSGLTSEMKMWNEQLAGARAVQIFENLGNANAIIEDVKQRTSLGLAQTTQALIDMERTGAEVQAMGAEALQRADPNTKIYDTDAQREADVQPDGTRSYTIESRTNHTRTGGEWVLIGSAVASSEEVQTVSDAFSNTALAELATRGITDPPQFVDGSRWVRRVASPLPQGGENGGTVVAGVGCYWCREYSGSTVYGSWFGMKADYNWATDTYTTDNTEMLRRMVSCGAKTCIVEDAVMGYFMGGSAGREVVIPPGVTLQGSGRSNYCRRHKVFPFAKFVIKQAVHPVLQIHHNIAIKGIYFIYPDALAWTTWDGDPNGAAAQLPQLPSYPPTISGYRAIANDSVEGWTLDRCGILGGSLLYHAENSTTQQAVIRQPFGYCFGSVIALRRGFDTVRIYDPQISPNFLPDGTTVNFMSYCAKYKAIFLNLLGKVDDLKVFGGLLYGQMIAVNQEADASAGNYCTGGTFTDVAIDGCHIGYRIAGKTPGFGLKIIGGFVTPIVGDDNRGAVVFEGPLAAGSRADIIALNVYGTSDAAIAPVCASAWSFIKFVGGAQGCSVNVMGGQMYEYTQGDNANSGMGGWWVADGASAANLRVSASNLIRKDGRVITTAHDGIFMTANGNSADEKHKGFIQRVENQPLTASATGSANPTQDEFNRLFADFRDLRLRLIAAGIMVAD